MSLAQCRYRAIALKGIETLRRRSLSLLLPHSIQDRFSLASNSNSRYAAMAGAERLAGDHRTYGFRCVPERPRKPYQCRRVCVQWRHHQAEGTGGRRIQASADADGPEAVLNVERECRSADRADDKGCAVARG